MIEVRFHGRGGQGAVTAAELLAVAVGMSGKYSQSFPMFGVERRGAPVMAFCRVSDRPIRIHQGVEHPNYVVVLDSSLLDYIDVTHGIRDEKVVIVNTNKTKDEILNQLNVKDVNLYVVDATSIALKHIGVPIVNTAILGAFAKIADWVDRDQLIAAVRERFEERPDLADKNVKALEECYNLIE